MIPKKMIVIAVLATASLIACNDQKKKEQQAIDEAEQKMELEMAAETAKKKANNLLHTQKDSLRQVIKDSITQDSLRQVKEHGHAH